MLDFTIGLKISKCNGSIPKYQDILEVRGFISLWFFRALGSGVFIQVFTPAWPHRALSLCQTPHEKVGISIWWSFLLPSSVLPWKICLMGGTTNVDHVYMHIYTHTRIHTCTFFFTEENELLNCSTFFYTCLIIQYEILTFKGGGWCTNLPLIAISGNLLHRNSENAGMILRNWNM